MSKNHLKELEELQNNKKFLEEFLSNLIFKMDVYKSSKLNIKNEIKFHILLYLIFIIIFNSPLLFISEVFIPSLLGYSTIAFFVITLSSFIKDTQNDIKNLWILRNFDLENSKYIKNEASKLLNKYQKRIKELEYINNELNKTIINKNQIKLKETFNVLSDEAYYNVTNNLKNNKCRTRKYIK